ncbi:unnamed protein product [Scytosiphon promiscuus]
MFAGLNDTAVMFPRVRVVFFPLWVTFLLLHHGAFMRKPSPRHLSRSVLCSTCRTFLPGHTSPPDGRSISIGFSFSLLAIFCLCRCCCRFLEGPFGPSYLFLDLFLLDQEITVASFPWPWCST